MSTDPTVRSELPGLSKGGHYTTRGSPIGRPVNYVNIDYFSTIVSAGSLKNQEWNKTCTVLTCVSGFTSRDFCHLAVNKLFYCNQC